MSERTEHGFRTGPITVSALAETSRGAAIGVEVDRGRSIPLRFDLVSTPHGRESRLVLEQEDVQPGYQRLVVVMPDGVEVWLSGAARYGYVVSAHDEDGYINGFGTGRETR